jgi:prepilin-type N-terminal cleavage/methylation domain-containing protein
MIDTNFLRRRRAPIRQLRLAVARRGRLAAEDGFTLIEVLVATVVLAVGLVALLGVLNVTNRASTATRAREGGTNLARQIIEDAVSIPYAQLSPSSIVGQLQAMNELADISSAPGWQVSRRGFTYTVTPTECSIDEPKDGYGKHVNAFGENPFCPDSSTEWKEGEPEDVQPADMKRITVNVSWQIQGHTSNVEQVATLTSAGAAPGLTAGKLELKTPEPKPSEPTLPVVTETTSPLIFSVSAPAGTHEISWALDGSAQTCTAKEVTPKCLASAPVRVKGTETEETEWTFQWPITGLSDGTYEVSAQAIDTTGVAGPPVSIPVNLIRGQPAAPKGIIGGFNTINVGGVPTNVVELQWRANSERNVIGYRIYKQGGKKELVDEGSEAAGACPGSLETLSIALSCIDFSTPRPTDPEYSIAALYRDKEGHVQEGPASSFTVATGPAPKAPELKANKQPDGSVKLEWTEPSGGPEVLFYRIYRGSTDYTGRYDTAPTGAPGATVAYTDNDAVVAHTYWVTAVTSTLTESSFSNSWTE